MDQTLAAMHILAMFTMRQDNSTDTLHLKILLMDDNSSMLMLRPGYSKIYLSEEFESRSGCGLIPFAMAPTNVTTRGLKWNLGDFEQR